MKDHNMTSLHVATKRSQTRTKIITVTIVVLTAVLITISACLLLQRKPKQKNQIPTQQLLAKETLAESSQRATVENEENAFRQQRGQMMEEARVKAQEREQSRLQAEKEYQEAEERHERERRTK